MSSTPLCLTATTATAAVAMCAPHYADTAPTCTTTTAAATTSSLDPTPSTSRATSALPSTIQSHRQWSWSARSRRLNAADNRRRQSNATEEISSLAKLQSEYYKRKLEMKEQQHMLYVKEQEKKMKVLDLQEQYYAAKLRKLAEE